MIEAGLINIKGGFISPNPQIFSLALNSLANLFTINYLKKYQHKSPSISLASIELP